MGADQDQLANLAVFGQNDLKLANCWCALARQFLVTLIQQNYPFLHKFAEFGINFRFFFAIHAAGKKFGANTNEALFLVAPFHELPKMRRLFFNLFACHKSLQKVTSIRCFDASPIFESLSN